MKQINILWFKKDLRIFDNEALCEAIKDNDILPIYIIENSKEKYDINQAKYLYRRAMKLELDFFNAYSDF